MTQALTPAVTSPQSQQLARPLARPLVICMTLALLATALPMIAAKAQGSTAQIKKTTGMWVEGPGYDINYGGTYEQCATRCLAAAPCVMIEYYRPEKKCNMYNAVRPLKIGGSSIVGTKTPKVPAP